MWHGAFNLIRRPRESRVCVSLRANGSRECAPDDRLREAIHLATQRKSGLLRRFAPRNDVAPISKTRLRVLAARCARVVHESFGPRNEGAGNAGRLMHPQPRVRNKIKHTSIVTTVTPVSSGIPRAMVLTAYFVLSPATNSSCHRHPRIKGLYKARSGRLASANLTPATGARTTRLHRPLKRRSSACHSSAHGPCRPALPSPDIA